MLQYLFQTNDLIRILSAILGEKHSDCWTVWVCRFHNETHVVWLSRLQFRYREKKRSSRNNNNNNVHELNKYGMRCFLKELCSDAYFMMQQNLFMFYTNIVKKKYPSSIGVSSGARWTHRVRMQTSSMHFDIFWFASWNLQFLEIYNKTHISKCCAWI